MYIKTAHAEDSFGEPIPLVGFERVNTSKDFRVATKRSLSRCFGDSPKREKFTIESDSSRSPMDFFASRRMPGESRASTTGET